ncbi:MAG: tRNA (adenosine(37)-N6)-dimethylallyltransferase MiaA [Bryobacteraceae bacterium]|jgi:tRNA dimethylallyltransferase
MPPDEPQNLRLLAIVGPTGAGKSALALRVARQFNGEIVNCDSLQLYRSFDVGTAKPPLAARKEIPHHLFDVLGPQEGYSAGEYARHARESIRQISLRGRLPVITGGTGFYLKALLHGLPHLPPKDPSLRTSLAERENRRRGALHRLLGRLDPAAAARIHPNDLPKLIRALEVRILTRRPVPSHDTAEPLRGYRILQVGLNPERSQLYELLDARTQEMFQSGLVEEVKELLARGCSGLEKPFESIGYRQAVRYVQGSITLEEAVASTQLETRQYAKRQLTWFRRDPQIKWLSGFGHSVFVLEQCLEYVR